jgi:uncharacterized protein involved in response to NO
MTAQSSNGLPIRKPAFALFAYGFRPFFWLAAAFALIAIMAWLGVVSTGLLPLPGQPALIWHGHEMPYGFIGAAIAGFLLTAVPSWTGARGFAGAPLVLLVLVWLAGRLAFAMASVLPLTVVAVCELAFIPALACLVAPPLLRSRNRNTPLLFVLLAVWISDAVFMVALMRGDGLLARLTLMVAIDIVLLLITVIGGRIVPAFTSSALRGRGLAADLRTSRWADGVAIGSMIAIVIVDIFAPWQRAAAVAAVVAAIAHLWRLSGWRSLRTLGEPLVWSLHLAYAWMPVGLALKGTHLLTGSPWTAHWLHALTIGAAASMVVAVMTRAALGHTGRPLLAARSIAIAYLLLSFAALVRVFLPAFGVIDYSWTIIIAGAIWLAAFALFLIKYTPILMRPRIDRRQG